MTLPPADFLQASETTNCPAILILAHPRVFLYIVLHDVQLLKMEIR